MPTSVLLAVLAAAGMLALAPALVRRYDAAERQVAEREHGTARVLTRRRRTVPQGRPVNPPLAGLRAPVTDDGTDRPGGTDPLGGTDGPGGTGRPDQTRRRRARSRETGRDPHHDVDRLGEQGRRAGRAAGAPVTAGRAGAVRARRTSSTAPVRARRARSRGRTFRRRLRRGPLARLLLTRPFLSRPGHELSDRARQRWWRYHRRRVLVTLLALPLIGLVAGAVLAPGFYVAAGSAVLLLVAYLVHLRNRALAEARHRREEARQAAATAARARRARRRAADRAAARRAAQEHAARQEADRLAAERAAAERETLERREAEHLAAERRAIEQAADRDPGRAAAARARDDRSAGDQPTEDSAAYLRGRPYQARAANF